MTVKDDFISLFAGHEPELLALPETHFPIKDFSYMITSQRTTSQIHHKLQSIIDRIPAQHQNFWADLAREGLVNAEHNNLSLFGRAVYDYFESETDEFKREHFIFNGIRQKAYDVPQSVLDEYNQYLQNLYDCLDIIPLVNQAGQELLNNPEKLLITAFLNTFPYALERYYQLTPQQQTAIYELHESGLKQYFEHPQPTERAYKRPAQRLWNMWRAVERRAIFVKSAILAHYEEICIFGRADIPFRIEERFEKLLNPELLTEIINLSDKIEIKGVGADRIIGLIPELRTYAPTPRTEAITTRRNTLVKRRRKTVRRRITNLEDLTRIAAPETQPEPTTIDPLTQAQINELRHERTLQHQEIVKKFGELYKQNNLEIDENTFDLLVELDKFVLLHEMKTITVDNERNQIIKAVGQLYYYEFFEIPSIIDTTNKSIVKIIALQSKPTDLMHIEYLKSIGILTLWVGDNNQIEGEADSIAFLKSLLPSLGTTRR
jgi:tRNA A37 N6-isopentenylltransferase MiaA